METVSWPSWDADLFLALYDLFPHAGIWVVLFGYTTLLAPVALMGVPLFLLVYQKAWNGRWKLWGKTIGAFGAGLLPTVILMEISKALLARDRPIAYFESRNIAIHFFPWHELREGSFPSGGAGLLMLACLFVAFMIARNMKPNRRWISFAVGALVVVWFGYTRIYVSAHFLLDVVAGWIYGVVGFAICLAVWRRWMQETPER